MTFSIYIPHFKCFINKSFFYNWDSQQTGFVPVRVFGLTSIPGRSVGFNLITNQVKAEKPKTIKRGSHE
jgi:hypothetical protein